MQLINVELMKHPLNWLTVILMVLIGGIGLHFFLQWASGNKTQLT